MFGSMPVYKTPICPRCGKAQFGIREIEVQGANFRHYAVLCTACGCVVGTESLELIDRFNRLEERMNRAGFPKAE